MVLQVISDLRSRPIPEQNSALTALMGSSICRATNYHPLQQQWATYAHSIPAHRSRYDIHGTMLLFGCSIEDAFLRSEQLTSEELLDTAALFVLALAVTSGDIQHLCQLSSGHSQLFDTYSQAPKQSSVPAKPPSATHLKVDPRGSADTQRFSQQARLDAKLAESTRTRSASRPHRKPYKFAEVFAGIGTFALAMLCYDFELYGVCENDEICHSLLTERHPEALAVKDFYDHQWKLWEVASGARHSTRSHLSSQPTSEGPIPDLSFNMQSSASHNPMHCARHKPPSASAGSLSDDVPPDPAVLHHSAAASGISPATAGSLSDGTLPDPPSIRVLVGGPACTPYSPAGKQHHENDPVSSQIADMADMAAHLNPDIVIIENVVQLLHADAVIAGADAAFHKAGYTRVFHDIVSHSDAGGSSIRARVFIWYEWAGLPPLPPPVIHVPNVASSVLLEHLLPVEEVPLSSTVPGDFTPAQRELDTSDVTLVGYIAHGGPSSPLERGSLVTINDSPHTWRVMGTPTSGRTFRVLRNHRKFPWSRHILASDVKSQCRQSTPVYSVDAKAKSIRAFGEWPVRTCMLIYDTRFSPPRVRPLETREVWSVMELEPHLYEDACRHGADEDKLYRLAGNANPMSMLKPIAAALQQRLEDIDGFSQSRAPPSTTITHLAVVHIPTPSSWKDDATELVLVTSHGTLPTAITPLISRAQSTTHALSLLPSSLSHLHVKQAGEQDADGCVIRVVTASHAATPIPVDGHSWVPLSALSGIQLDAALRSMCFVASFLPQSVTHTARLHGGAFEEGKTPAKRVKLPSLAQETSPDLWSDVQAKAASDRALLHDTISSLDDALPHTEYIKQWASCVTEPPVELIPDSLRADLGTYKDPALLHEPFINRCLIPDTDYLPRPDQQIPPAGFHPTSIYHLLEDHVVDSIIPNWVRRQLEDLQRFQLHGASARRSQNCVLALGQDAFRPAARGIVWDLRRLSDGIITPLDFQAPIQTHFNLPYLESMLRDCPDQELVSFLLEGVQLKASLDLQIVFLPHLLSLAQGFASVEAELQKLAAKGWYGLFSTLPFVPIRCQPQGSVPRKLEERWRRVMEAGAPRTLVFDSSGRSVIPLNDASKGARSAPQVHYTSQDDHPVDITQPWPRELKPTLADYMHDCAILMHASVTCSVPLYLWADDVSNFFHQFALSPSEFWKVCVLYLPLTDGHPDFTYAVEHVMAMGLFQASNVAQRAANVFVDIVCTMVDRHINDITLSEPLQQWLTSRASLNTDDGFRHDRPYIFRMYTDDTFAACLTPEVFIAMLSAWHEFTTSMNLIMAAHLKRQAGSMVTALGAHMFAAECVVIIPKEKILRAAERLKRLVNGKLIQEEYRSLLGLLEHIAMINRSRRNVLYGMYDELAGHGPSDLVQPSSHTVKQANRWHHTLLHSAGCNFLHALPGARNAPLLHQAFHIYSDAAVEGAHLPSLGGYFHGYWWTLPLPPAMRTLPISHLEFVAAIINFQLFVRTMLPDDPSNLHLDIVSHIDNLGTRYVIVEHSAHSPAMVFLHEHLMATPEFVAHSHRWLVNHVYSEGNFLADAASRGQFTALRQMCQQLGVTPTQLQLPLDLILLMYDLLDFTEAQATSLHKPA